MATKEFDLPKDILGPNSAESITIGGSTDADVLEAILNNTKFPSRPNGNIELGHIELKASGGSDIKFNAGQGTVGFNFSAGFQTGIAVFDKATDAINTLHLDNAPKLDLAIPGDPTTRYLLMLLGYQASGNFSGSHPIGVLGTATFGAQASGSAIYAVLHRFPGDTGAQTVLQDTISSWRLPRHVEQANDLKPYTWLIAETSGSIAIQLAAQLGYDVNFVRQANLLGMTRELSAKIDANIKATFGFNASGRYIIIVGRESDNGDIRLRLYKQSDHGFNFGLNLNVGLTTKAELPPNIDEFVKAVFGVHGLQVVNDLHLIEQWTDPTKDLGDTVARLLNKTGLELLTKVTGSNAQTEFDTARQKVLDAFKLWDSLPSRVSAATWQIFSKLNDTATTEFKNFLTILSDPDKDARNQALIAVLKQVAFGDSPQGQWLEAIAEQGLLALSNQLDKVGNLATQTLNILNGGIIKKLQDFINEKLDLTKVLNAVTEADFNSLDEWLIKRLGDFLDKTIVFQDLKEVQTAINLVIKNANSIYDRALKALNNKYNLEFAASYQRNTTSTALLDVNFDLNDVNANALFRDVVAKSRLDELLLKEVSGVTLNQATFSHEIKRNSSVQIHLPFFNSESQHINDSLASLNVEHDAGRVLAYQLSATDTVQVKNRYLSQLSILGNLKVRAGKIDPTSLTDQSIAYQSLQVKSNMTLAELKFRTQPFIHNLLPQLFPDDGAIDRFYMGLDQTISNTLGNRNNNFGDMALNLQVSLPASVLAAWFQPLSQAEIHNIGLKISLVLQRKLKELIPFYYLQDIDRVEQNFAVAALLTWAAFPLSTSIDFQNDQIQSFNTDKELFWNFPNKSLRKAMVFDSHTRSSLSMILTRLHDRLLNAGKTSRAGFFAPEKIGDFQQLAVTPSGDILLNKLLVGEAEMISGTAKALANIQQGLANLASAPIKAISHLADFGAKLTATFNNLPDYGNEYMRTLSSLILAETSATIMGTSVSIPKAMLNLYVLTNGHTFSLNNFLTGDLPPQTEIAIGQTLTNLK